MLKEGLYGPKTNFGVKDVNILHTWAVTKETVVIKLHAVCH